MSTKKNKPARGPAKTSPKASPAARQGAPVSPARGGPEAGRIHGTALVWTGLLVVSLALNGCPRFTVYYAAYLAVSIGLALGSLAFVRAVYLRGRTELHLGFKKFVGYSLVLHYAAAALPRVDWSTAGLIGPGRVAFLFALCLLCLAAGIFLFFLAGRPKALAELGILNAEELRDRALRRKRLSVRKKGFIPGLLDWVDALAFAVIAVIVVNIFVFQLYRIPSESMVPVFLNGDRPFTIKAIAGPKIPLTAWRLPIIKLPSRGDVVTIANPRYPENHRVDLKKYLTQLVAMVTFTAVNIDPTAPDGSPKADPLVKRVVGLPGEKLMMVDDFVYSKRKGDAAYALVEADRRWAKTDLWKESAAVRSHIEEIPVDEDTRAILVAWDAKKRDSDPAALAASLVASLRAIEAALPSRRVAALEADLVKKLPDTIAARDALINGAEAGGANVVARGGTVVDDLALLFAAARSERVRAAIRDYCSNPQAGFAAANAYERGSRVFNLLVKKNLLDRVARDAALISSGAGIEAMGEDADRLRLAKEQREIYIYLQGLYDARNFPEFPAGGAYLGSDEYFAMGDNRYNSLDFRFRTAKYSMRPLDPADPSSILYPSMLDPFPLGLEFIEGYAIFRLWPFNRLGPIR